MKKGLFVQAVTARFFTNRELTLERLKQNKMNENKIQEIQFLEQHLQNILIQKQTFDLELSEIQNALQELEKSNEEVYKIVGQLMIKSNKKEIQESLSNKIKIIELRLSGLSNQEKSINEKVESLREEILNPSKK